MEGSIRPILGIVAEVMVVDSHALLDHPRGAIAFTGHILDTPERSLQALNERLTPVGYVATLQHVDGRDILTLYPYSAEKHHLRPYLALALLVATVISTLFVGATMVQPDLQHALEHLLSGWPFAASLLSILGVHEMGHFIAARRNGVKVSLPYFIPMPLGPFGTMGAFITMKSPPSNRKQLLQIGLAGPVSGLVVALAVILYGLSTSPVMPIDPGTSYFREGNSIAYLLLKYLVFGQWLPAGDIDVNLTPVAFAGWAGLLVTGLNLIPAAQLDGGHIAYALFGRRAKRLTFAIGISLLLLALLWPGWLVWSALILVLGARQEILLDDITPLSRGERVAGLLALALFLVLFVPVPLQLVQP